MNNSLSKNDDLFLTAAENNKINESNLCNITYDNNPPKILNENLFSGKGFKSNKEEFEKKMSLKLGSTFSVESSLMSSLNLSMYDDNYEYKFSPVIPGEAGYDVKYIGDRQKTRRFKGCLIRKKERGKSAPYINKNKLNPIKKKNLNFNESSKNFESNNLI